MDQPLLSTLLRKLHLGVRRAIYDDVRAAGFDDITLAHLYVFQLPGPDGVGPTDLAERLNMTKQAMNHLLATLEANGYIERVPHPTDGRGKVLRSTPKGRAVARIMQQTSRRLEREWARDLGRARFERLRAELRSLADLVDNDVSQVG